MHHSIIPQEKPNYLVVTLRWKTNGMELLITYNVNTRKPGNKM